MYYLGNKYNLIFRETSITLLFLNSTKGREMNTSEHICQCLDSDRYILWYCLGFLIQRPINYKGIFFFCSEYFCVFIPWPLGFIRNYSDHQSIGISSFTMRSLWLLAILLTFILFIKAYPAPLSVMVRPKASSDLLIDRFLCFPMWKYKWIKITNKF